jgi:uncharacterized phage protein (TIGR01671 family)
VKCHKCGGTASSITCRKCERDEKQHSAVARREIKFRAWDIFYKKFIYSDDGPSTIRMSEFWQKVEGGLAAGREVPVDTFTGLKDKNGKGIYEWDLGRVKDDTILAHQREYVQRVEMHNGCWRPTMMFVNGNEVEVIGNIHENPELLGEDHV